MKKTIILIVAAAFVSFAAYAQQWSPVGENIKTPWADQVDPSCPRPEYPRPHMVRGSWMNLNGLWNYGISDASAASCEAQGKILVPFALESDSKHHHQDLWEGN